MFTINPFSELSGLISPIAMQVYVIAMVILVVGGTLLDTIHKKSAQYFFENSKKAQKNATRTVRRGKGSHCHQNGGQRGFDIWRVLQSSAAGSPTFSPCTVSSCLSPPPPS